MSYFDFNNNRQKLLGSRDLMDAKCYSFECNPDCLIECKKNNFILIGWRFII